MFSRDLPPYGGGVVLGLQELGVARARLKGFAWVGLLELMGTSLLLLAAKLGVPLARRDFARARASHTPAYDAFARTLRLPKATPGARNPQPAAPHAQGRVARVLAANALDEALWDASRRRQCADLAALGLQAHPVATRDLDEARDTPPCATRLSPLLNPHPPHASLEIA